MLYGYVSDQLNPDGLFRMKEVTVSASPCVLRDLAQFVLDAADELEHEHKSNQWHRHAPSALQKMLGCEFIVLSPNE